MTPEQASTGFALPPSSTGFALPPSSVHPRGTLRHAFFAVRHKKLSRFGLVLFACIVHLSVFADFFASSDPVLCRTPAGLVFLANVTHDPSVAAARARGELTVYLHPAVPHGPDERSSLALEPPLAFWDHPLGTDALGRDVLARLVHGARVLAGLALAVVAVLVVVGTVVGALAGFFGGLFDVFVARLIETMSAFPTILLVLVLQAMSGQPSKLFLVIAVSIARFAEVVRVVRAEVLQIQNQEYVIAARATGASPLRILWRHIAPNARAQAIASATFSLSTLVLAIAACDFLGFGLSHIAPTWGEMMAQLREHPTAWWLLVFPVLCLFALVLSQTVVGETLQDALDPRTGLHGDE